MSSDVEWTDEADVVIVGGGVIGASAAYHLCLAGVTNVVILERNELSSGATARAAGLLSHARSDRNVTKMVLRTRAAIAELEALLGDPIGFRQVGAIRAAHTDERQREMLAMEANAAAEGVAVARLDARDAQALCPWLDLGDAQRIIFVPADGYVDGARLGLAYAKAARRLGAYIWRGVEATGIVLKGAKIEGVRTSRGAVRCRFVIDAAGAWAGEIAHWLGWGLPAAPTRSHYWITAPDGNGPPERPTVQLPDLGAYMRSEVGGLVVGIREPQSPTYDPLTLARDMESMLLHDEIADLDLLVEQAAGLRAAVPGIDEWRFAHHITGLSTYTPDGKFVLGETGVADGFLVAGGCCGAGVTASGGIGQALSDLITGRAPDIELAPLRPDRFGSVDPRSQDFRDRCAAARGSKSSAKANAAA